MERINNFPPRNVANGYCGLDGSGIVALAQLPASVKDDLVTADATDALAGHLDAKVDNTTIEVNSTAHVIRVKALGIANAHIATAAAITWTKVDKTGAVASDVGAQASDTDLSALAGLTGTSIIPERTGSGTWSERSVNAPGRDGLAGLRTLVNKSSSDTLTTAQSDSILENTGATAQVVLTLPAASAGLQYTFLVQDTDGIRIRAPSSTYIRVGATSSTAAGYVESATQYSSITIVCLNSTNWVATSSVGTWTAA